MVPRDITAVVSGERSGSCFAHQFSRKWIEIGFVDMKDKKIKGIYGKDF